MKHILICLAALVFLYKCNSSTGVTPDQSSTLELTIQARVQSRSQYQLLITGPDMDTIGPEMYYGGQTVRLYVPEGKKRTFTVCRYDSTGILTDSSVTVVTIGEGLNRIVISLKPLYRIFYLGNGTTNGSAPIDTSFYKAADSARVPGKADLEKAGYFFAGWNTKANGSGLTFHEDDYIQLHRNDTLYAHWVKIPTFTIIYNGNGCAGKAPLDTNRYEEGDTVRIEEKGDISFRGHFFVAWSCSLNNTDTTFDPGDTFIMGNKDVKLFAIWAKNPTYSISYDRNGGIGDAPVDTNRYEEGDTVRIEEKGDISFRGHFFVAWSCSLNNTDTTFDPGDTFIMGNENVKFFATWAKNPTYSIFYDGNGGTGDAPVDTGTYEQGTFGTVKGSGDLQRAGHHFSCWNLSRNGTDTCFIEGDQFCIQVKNDTLYAQWEKNQYLVRFDERGGTLVDSQEVYYEDKAVCPKKPYRWAHDFKGWYIDSLGTEAWNFELNTVKSDTVLYGAWQFRHWDFFYDNFESGTSIVTLTNTPDFQSVTVGFTFGDTMKFPEGHLLPFAGVSYQFNSEAEVTDLTGASSISFYAKADQPLVVRFRVETTNIQDYAFFGKEIDISTGWTQYTVPITGGDSLSGDLAQPSNWGTRVEWDPALVRILSWELTSGQNPDVTSGTLWIDDIVINE